MAENFGAYSNYYDLLYKDKNYPEEVKYIDDCIKRFAPSTKNILELGSGTGAHGLLLQKLGYDIFGIERSSGMVKAALEKGFQCQEGDICAFKLDRTYDWVLSMFHVISYLTTNEQLIDAFRNVSSHLKADGLFMFDVWYADAVLTQKASPRIKELESDDIKVTRFAKPVKKGIENVIEVNYEIIIEDKKLGGYERMSEKHPMRFFSVPEIELLGKCAGLELIGTFDFGTFDTPGEHSWGVNFLMKKNGG